jgi:glutamyl-tRNA reductase
MSLVCLGLNHKTAHVDVRERVAVAPAHLAAALEEIRASGLIEETVILSTCNRVEIYAASSHHASVGGSADNSAEVQQALLDYFIDHFELEPEHEKEFFRFSGEAAARHLFEVSGGLDSMVLGETEIFGQVKQAYADAQAEGTTRRVLNKLFQQAFTVGKVVRSNSQITRGSTSVGSVAVDLAEKIFGDLSGCRVMVVGAGDMSRRVGKSLKSRGADSIVVSNRSYDKAEALAAEMDGEAVRFDAWESVIHDVDIIISSTSAPHVLIGAEMIAEAMEKRRRRSLFLIDIAVPRDIDPLVNEVENVYLYDIDALDGIASLARRERQRQIAACEKLIDAYIDDKGIPALEPAPKGAPKDAPSDDEANPGSEPVAQS